MLYKSATNVIPSYTFECQGVDGTLPLNQAFRLPTYTLIFTRAPSVKAITPSTILTPQPANAVARASSSIASNSQPGNAALLTATSAPKRTTSMLSIGLPPSSPPRTTAPKLTKSKRSKPAAGANGEEAKPTKRHKLTTDEALVASTSGTRVAASLAASTSAAPTPATRKKRRKAASTTPPPVASTSTGPIPSTSAALASLRVNPLTVKEQEAQRKNDEVLQQWTAEWVSHTETCHKRERPLRMAGAVDGEADETEKRLFQLINGRIRERVRYGPLLDSDSPARCHITDHLVTVKVLARLAVDLFLLPPLDSFALRRVDYNPFISKEDGLVLKPTECEGVGVRSRSIVAQWTCLAS